jgi:thiol-disulfide isomerase/thioredoxin
VGTLVRALVALLGFVAVTCAGRPKMPDSASHPLLGKPLPQLAGRKTLTGTTLDEHSTAGKVVVVKFFAEYCEPCKVTLPAAEKLHREHRDVLFIGVSEDESRSTAEDVSQKYGLTFAVVHDPAQVLGGRFRVSTMPATFVADKSSVVRWFGDERLTEADLEGAIASLR